MNVLDRILATRGVEPHAARAYPLGVEIDDSDTRTGRDAGFSPAEYGNYIVSSNEIYSVVNYRARMAAGLKLKAYDQDGPDRQLVTAGPEVDLLRKVNPFWTFERLIRQTEMSMGLWGQAGWAISRGRNGAPAEAYWLNGSRLKPVPHRTKWLAGFLYTASNGQDIAFAPDEVVWFRYPNPLDEYAGLSPVAAARLAADVASASMKSNKSIFTQGMQVGGLVIPKGGRTTFTEPQAKQLEEDIERRFKGADKAHKWGVLRFEADLLKPSVTPKDAEWLAGLNVTFRQVCRAYGVPSPLLFDLEHATLANLRELQRALWENALVPDMDFYAADLREQFLPMFGRRRAVNHVEWDYTTVPALQESITSVWDRERQQVESGLMTINEWRTSKGMPPVDWGDTWHRPVNKAAVDGSDTTTAAGDTQAAADDPTRFEKLVLAELADLAASLPSSNGANHV